LEKLTLTLSEFYFEGRWLVKRDHGEFGRTVSFALRLLLAIFAWNNRDYGAGLKSENQDLGLLDFFRGLAFARRNVNLAQQGQLWWKT
jgi:hypothetical protein